MFGKYILDKEFGKACGIQYFDHRNENSLFHKMVNYY